MNPDHADANDQRDDERRISYFEMWKNAAALALKIEMERDQWKQAAELNAAYMRREYARANFLEIERDRLREAIKDAVACLPPYAHEAREILRAALEGK